MENEKRLTDVNPIIRNLTAMKSMYDAIALDGMIKAAPRMAAESREKEILKKALQVYGVVSQINMVFEEMSELQKELCKYLRGRDNQSEIAEEIADVEIMLAQMKLLFGFSELVDSYRKKKIDRLRRRIEQDLKPEDDKP